MSEILLSVRPKWFDLMIVGMKSLEVRKTKPIIRIPFRCHIYETSAPREKPWMDEDGHAIFKGRSMVVATFICDYIKEFSIPYPAYRNEMDESVIKESCLTYQELHRYAGSGNLFGWHISDLQVFEAEKPLSEYGMNHPPQSWCYLRKEREVMRNENMGMAAIRYSSFLPH